MKGLKCKSVCSSWISTLETRLKLSSSTSFFFFVIAAEGNAERK